MNNVYYIPAPDYKLPDDVKREEVRNFEQYKDIMGNLKMYARLHDGRIVEVKQ